MSLEFILALISVGLLISVPYAYTLTRFISKAWWKSYRQEISKIEEENLNE